MGNPFYVAAIEGYASVFNAPDQNGDIVAPGAFAASLQQRAPVRMLYQHQAAAPLGRWLSLKEDARGLYARGEIILASDHARDVYALLRGGAIDGLSIGFQTVKAQKTAEGRRILKADLWEVSIVTFPMAPTARILRVGPPEPAQTPTQAPAPHEQEDALFAEIVRGAGAILAESVIPVSS